MRKDFGAKNFLYPQPVFIIATYNEDGTPDAMNAAWGGISGGTEVSVCIGASHKTAKNLVARGAFTLSMADVDNVAACDYVGNVSANTQPDKLSRIGWHTVKSPFVDAPLIGELALAVECRVKSYDPASGHLIGEIVNLSADERVLTDGKIDVKKLRPITFDGVAGTYLALGEVVAPAFEVFKTLL